MGFTLFIIDINECAGRNACDGNTGCVDSDGSYWCQCLPGFQGDGYNCTGQYSIHTISITPQCDNFQISMSVRM